MPTKLNREDLPEVEKQELIRILDLPKANRFPTGADIEFLKKRTDYLDDEEIKQFGPEVEKLFFYSKEEGEKILEKDLKDLGIKELKKIAKEKGISTKGFWRKKKADIIKAIEKAEKTE